MADALIMDHGKLAVSVLDDTITLEIECGDAYAAQVLYDEITERLQRGEGIRLGLQQPD